MKKLEVEVSCPGCQGVFTQLVAEMRPGAVRQCPNCGADIHFSGDDGAKAQKALDDLEKSFKNMFRK